MQRFIFILIAAGFLAFLALGGLNMGQETPPHPILDTAAAEKAEQPLAPAAEVTISEISYSQFETHAEAGEVIGMVITTRENGPAIVTARLKSGAIVRATMAGESVMTDELRNSIGETEVPYDVNYQAEQGSSFLSFLIPMVLIVALFLFLPGIINRMRGGGMGGGMGGAAGTNGSPGKEVETPKVRLADVGGVKHIKPQLDDMIEKVLDTGSKGRLGGEVPKGFLFLGPPGTGKTLLARAIAGEVNARRTDGKKVAFLTASGSDFIEMYVGVGAKRVRELFQKARKNAPCIVFIDEIDALGKRDGGAAHGGGGNDERVQTLNALLTELDGFEGDSGVIVIAATNREDMIDDALKRPGRFDRKVSVPLPDMTGREEILNIHAKNLQKRALAARVRQQRSAVVGTEGSNTVAPQGVVAKRIAGRGARKGKVNLPEIFAKDVDFKSIARETPACSGADLAEILKRAAEIAENRQADVITMSDIRNAFQSLRLGDEMPREQEFVDEFTTAVHEILGHAVVAGQSRKTLGRDHADDVQSLTIVPRGMSLGAVWTSPTKDRVSHSQKYLLGRLRIAMAGQIAEKLYLGPDAVTSGASSDIQAATNIAAGMVSQYAMSNSEELTFRNYMEQGGFGVTKANAEMVDQEIDKLLREQYIRAEAIMLSFASAKDADGNDLMEMLTRAMLVKKTLQGEEFMRLISGEVVFDRPELDLGAQEAEFQTLWNAQLNHRKARVAALKKDHATIANDYGL